METLATSNSIIANSTPPPHFSASLKERLLCAGPGFVSYRRPRKLAGSGLQHLAPLRRGGIAFISCLSSHSQVDSQKAEVENRDTNITKTVRVKFQLQKECTFGEHFFIVGDDPMFGSWDVTSAIPLNWADGHQWTAEVEIPVGKTIQFKFVLQEITGTVVWQPDPDRTFLPWETTNTIIITEDWDSAESRILREEEKIVNQDEDSPIVSEKLLVEEKLNYVNGFKDSPVALSNTSVAEDTLMETQGELIDGSNISGSEENHSNVPALEENTNKDSPVAVSDISVAEKSLIESLEELIDGSNVSALEENASNTNVSLSEDNTSNIPTTKENSMAEALESDNKAISEVQSNSNEEMEITSQSHTMITEENSKKEETKITAQSDTMITEENSKKEETEITAQSDTMITEDNLKKEEKDATVTILGNTDVQGSFIDYGVPILVPGLPPTTATSSQDEDPDRDAPQHEVEDDVAIVGNNKLPQKQDPDVVVAEQGMEGMSSYEEDIVQREILRENNSNKIENEIVQNEEDIVQREIPRENDSNKIENEIVQNITWGHKTLRKFFSSLRLL